jgi:hypothetical protein
MKPTDSTMSNRMVVYRYAVYGDLPEAAIAELSHAHQLQTRLVEIERAYAEQVAAVWATQPQVTAADQRIQECSARVEELTRAAVAERERTGRRRVADATAQALQEARAVRREARTARRELQQRLYPVVKPQMAEAEAARVAAIKATYRPAIDDGLYWATYNEVVGQHRAAVARVKARRKQGFPAEVRVRRVADTGTIVVQLPRGRDDPPRTPGLLVTRAGRWRNIAQLRPWYPPEAWQRFSRGEQRRLARGSFRFRVGSGGAAQLVEVPVIVHRPLPPEADVAMVRITREQVAGHFRAWISVVARVPAPPVRVAGPTVAVHLGWRSLSDGALRVAVAAGVSAPPEDLADVARHHGSWYEIVLPASWRAVAGQLDAIRSRRGVELDKLRDWLVAWTSAHPAPTPHPVLPLPDELRGWRSPRDFAELALRLRRRYVRGQVAEAAQRLEAWRRKDRHLWEWEANERRQLLDRRNDAWRRVAAWLTDQAGQVLVDSWTLTSLGAVPDVAAPDEQQARAARANLRLGAPGTLRSAIENAAQARGVPVNAPEFVAATHYSCGSPLDVADRMASVLVYCQHCDVQVDQDYNALSHLLEAGHPGTATG